MLFAIALASTQPNVARKLVYSLRHQQAWQQQWEELWIDA
jgi:hypothetical protein